MKTREDILEAVPKKITDEKTNSYYWTKEDFGAAILEVLLDIRELLQATPKQPQEDI